MSGAGVGRGARALVGGALAAAAIAFAACGSDDGAAGGVRDAVPADAVLYAEAAIRPEGDLRDQLDTLLERFGSVDPGALIAEAIDSAAAEDDVDISYADDIEPWLGEHAAVFMLDFGSVVQPAELGVTETQDLAVLIESADDDAANAFVDKALEQEGGATEESFDGHDYSLVDGETAIAVTDGVVVFGSQSAVEASFQTLDGGEALADDETATGELDDEALASLYVDVASAVASGGGVDDEGQAALDLFAPNLLDTPVTGAIELGDDTVAADFSYGSLGDLGALYLAGGSSPLLGELPGEAWVAGANPDVGTVYADLLDRVAEAEGDLPPGSSAQINLFETYLQQFAGVSVDEALGAIGDVAYYVGGADLQRLSGAVVIEITDEATATKLLQAAGRQLGRQPGSASVQRIEVDGAPGLAISDPELPEAVQVVLDGDRAVIGYGEQATRDALAPQSTLGDAETFSAAESALGSDTPMATFMDLERAVPAIASLAGGEVALAMARQYVEPLSYLAAGSSDDGETGRSRIVVGFE